MSQTINLIVRIKMQSTSETKCLKKGMKSISPIDEIHHLYKKQRINATVIVRKARRDDNLKQFGSHPTAKTKYKTLKLHENEEVGFQDYPELDSLKKHFTTIGSHLSSKLLMNNLIFNIPANENAMVNFPRTK